MYPEDLKYTKTHEWVKVEDDKVKMESPRMPLRF